MALEKSGSIREGNPWQQRKGRGAEFLMGDEKESLSSGGESEFSSVDIAQHYYFSLVIFSCCVSAPIGMWKVHFWH